MSDVDGVSWLDQDVLFRDKSSVKRAMDVQDEIRASSGEGNLSDEVRKWRDKRK